MLATFRTLMKFGVTLEHADSEGLTVLQHAIKKNNEALARFIVANAGPSQVSHRDSQGGTAAHTCVRPFAFGSYENVQILRFLHENGHDLAA
mmetsp:Transcript_152/g.286  ORF Transcript_152/g.286 Transcript_152/m.286 type:complete len:92 (+) Transcript_152:3305-3580(+)